MTLDGKMIETICSEVLMMRGGGGARGTERLSDVDSRTVAQGAEPRPAKAVAPPGAPGALLVLTCTGPHASVSGIFLP